MSQNVSPVVAVYVSENESDRFGEGWTMIFGFAEDSAKKHGGIVVELPTEGWFLAIFKTALDAITCAVDIQRRSIVSRVVYTPMKRLNRTVETLIKWPRCLIGVNYEMTPVAGMAWPTGRDDGVDRLVSLSEPGGICLSRTIYDDVRYHVDLPFNTERDPNHTAYLCQEIRRKLGTFNLLEAGAVRVNAVNFTTYLTRTVRGSNSKSSILGKVLAFVGGRH
jgi:class 3 adenylate cyclase